ncbi:hypothetical protein NE237_001258 [Protea cynaroides]|uniref:Uncharacterized protein n=1 Tax=Protea cynaroides TaxID=273540 RepID=A0A9Q0QY83_9MAGN|nr:hypothetical protein NE237_001258 [Protea cynaroides]
MSTFSIISSPGLTESDNKSHTQRSFKSSTTDSSKLIRSSSSSSATSLMYNTWMLNKVKVELDDFDIAFVDLDCLDQVIIHLEKLLDVGFFRESLFDRRTILHYVALFLFVTYVLDEMQEKRLGKVIGEMLKVVPVIYSKGGFRLMLLDLLRNQFPPSLSLWPILKDAARDSDAVKKNYLVHLDEMHSRDWQTMKDALAYWIASFQSTLHPVTDPLKVEADLQLHFKQIIQNKFGWASELP